MAQKALANEIYLEEYNKLEVELRHLQKELEDTVSLNDDLTKVIAQKEEELLTKDRRLESLRDRNVADGEQLELELLTLTEKYTFEISTKEEVVRKLDVQYKRYQEVQKENDALRETVNKLQDLMESNRNEHAQRMHEKNLEMKHLREVMEKKMMDQLNKMDISYQKDAFAALSERHKKAMFQNAKLKDEVALQGVGLNNLGSRLGKQNQQYDVCIKQLRALNKRLRILKERLAIIAAKKIEIARKKEEVLADEAKLVRKQAILQSRLDAVPQTPACAEQREQLYIEILNTKCDVIMWMQRLALLQDLNMNLKPVYEYEQAGRFNPKAFPLEASQSLHSSVGRGLSSTTRMSGSASVGSHRSYSSHGSHGSRSQSPVRSESPLSQAAPSLPAADAPRPHSTTSSTTTAFADSHAPHKHHALVPMALKPFEIEELIERDPSLGAALAPLRGKEAQLMATVADENPKKKPGLGASVEPAARDQNMIAWVTLKLVDIWETTRLQTESLKNEKYAELEHKLDNLHTETAMASFFTDSTKQTGPQQSDFLDGDSVHIAEGGNGAGFGLVIDTAQSPPDQEEDEDLSLAGTPLKDRTISELAAASQSEREHGASKELRHEIMLQESLQGLLSESARSVEGLNSGAASAAASAEQAGALTPHPHIAPEDVPLLHLQSNAELLRIAGDSSPGTPRARMQLLRERARDWIENGDLDEDAVHQLWEEAFSTQLPTGSQSQSQLDGHHHMHTAAPLGVTSWLKRVAPAKRYPTPLGFLEGSTAQSPPKANSHHRRGRTSSTDSRPQTGDVNAVDTAALSRSLTTALLMKDIRPVDASAAFLVGPPVVIHDKVVSTDVSDAHDANTMHRSVTLPHIPSASKFEKSSTNHSSGILPLNNEYTGLEVTEEGLVLKDPLLGKKFTAQRKTLVAHATKAAAALKRASLEMQRSKSGSALPPALQQLGHTTPMNRQGLPQRAQGHSMSSNLIGQKQPHAGHH